MLVLIEYFRVLSGEYLYARISVIFQCLLPNFVLAKLDTSRIRVRYASDKVLGGGGGGGGVVLGV